MRMIYGDRKGPVREFHAGSGYWSQDSAVQVVATAEPPTQISIRWPGGKTTTSDVPAGAREIVVEGNGAAKVVK
jgi:hypothetical protein